MMKSINVFYEVIINSIKDIVCRKMQSGLTNVYLYGFSVLTETVELVLNEQFDLNVFFIDSNIDKQDGKRIVDLSNVNACFRNVIFVFSEHAVSMKENLLNNGFIENKDFYVLCDLSQWWEKQKKLFCQQRVNATFFDLHGQKKLMIEILDRVDQICKDNGLRYFIDSGTLIGAVRHHGFIPWDHDLDICMPIPDMYSLKELLKDNQILQFQSWDEDENYLLWSPRIVFQKKESIERIAGNHILICEFGIDVFPLAGFGNDIIEANRHIDTQDALWRRWRNIIISGRGSRRELIKEIKEFQLKYEYDKSEYVGPVNGTDMKYWALNKNKLFPTQKWEFEGKYYPIPHDYDSRLKVEYGDYMQIPSCEEIEKSKQKLRIVCEKTDA